MNKVGLPLQIIVGKSLFGYAGTDYTIPEANMIQLGTRNQ